MHAAHLKSGHILISLAAAFCLSAMLLLSGCRDVRKDDAASEGDAPRFMQILSLPEGGYDIVSVSPYDGSCDTLSVSSPLQRLVVMSTSHIGFLEAIGCDSFVVGVSGSSYICDSLIQERIKEGKVEDVGYEASPDYEKIVSLHPDLVLTYSVSGAPSRFSSKLKSLGISVFTVNEHMESSPLARAAYIRLFGALTGNMSAADSVLSAVTENYSQLAGKYSSASKRKALLNIPYNDQWFIPGGDSYMSRLISDAGGEVLGAVQGSTASSVISIEDAYSLGRKADIWLNVGWCTSMDQLLAENPLFGDFLKNIKDNAAAAGYSESNVVWNDNLRLSPSGGNDFWESGAVRPDLVLEDLVSILHPEPSDTKKALHYYRAIL